MGYWTHVFKAEVKFLAHKKLPRRTIRRGLKFTTKILPLLDSYLFCFLATGEWSKVGDMVTDPDKSGQTSSVGKSMFEGKEYDYVFNIDIDDNASALKMPYNNDQVTNSKESD